MRFAGWSRSRRVFLYHWRAWENSLGREKCRPSLAADTAIGARWQQPLRAAASSRGSADSFPEVPGITDVKPAVNRQPGYRRGTRRAFSNLETEMIETRRSKQAQQARPNPKRPEESDINPISHRKPKPHSCKPKNIAVGPIGGMTTNSRGTTT